MSEHVWCTVHGRWYGRLDSGEGDCPQCEESWKKSALADQEGGSHYKDMAIQPVEFIHKNGLGFLAGNAVKYLSRYKAKGGAEDIRKAIHYCNLILELEFEGK